jgi:hypothetical protein
MLKRRRNARCTTVTDSVLMNSRTQKILCCIAVILLSTDAAARLCARQDICGIRKCRTFSFKCYVDHSYTMYISGNIDVRNRVNLFEPHFTSKRSLKQILYTHCKFSTHFILRPAVFSFVKVTESAGIVTPRLTFV